MDLLNSIKNTLKPATIIKAGSYSSNCYTKENLPYKLLLRVDEKGLGRLVVNASTLLFLNQTSTEYVYHYVQGKYGDDVVAFMQSKYRAEKKEILSDYEILINEIEALLGRVDVNPQSSISGITIDTHRDIDGIPVKLDCYLTFRNSEKVIMDQTELDLAQWKKIIANSVEAGIPHFVLVGGDPLVRSDVFDLIAYSEELGVVMGLVSSQNALSVEKVTALIANGLDHLSVVVNAGNSPDWALFNAISEKNLFFKIVFEVTNVNYQNVQKYLANCLPNGVINIAFEMTEQMDQALFDALFDKIDEVGLSFNPFTEMLVKDGTGEDLTRYGREDFANFKKTIVMPDGKIQQLINGKWKAPGSILDGSWDDLEKILD